MEAPPIKPEMETSPILMSFEDIKRLFPDEWVMLGNPVYDEKHLHVVEGVPLLHGKNKQEVYYYGRSKKNGYTLYTVVYTGTFNHSGRYMTGIWRTRPA